MCLLSSTARTTLSEMQPLTSSHEAIAGGGNLTESDNFTLLCQVFQGPAENSIAFFFSYSTAFLHFSLTRP